MFVSFIVEETLLGDIVEGREDSKKSRRNRKKSKKREDKMRKSKKRPSTLIMFLTGRSGKKKD